MMTVTIYKTDTGAVDRVFTGLPDQAALQIQSGERAIEGSFPDDAFHVVAGGAVPRPSIDVPGVIAASAGDTVEISTDLPAETFVAIDGVAMGVVDDGELEIEVARPGVMHVRLTPPWPYRPAEIRIEADEAAAS